MCGSVHSMMTRIFEDESEPLFGRATAKIILGPLPISVLETALRDHNPEYTSEDLLTFFMLTGSVPKYMEVLIDGGAFDSEAMLQKIASTGSVFLIDGRDLLVTEFGKEYRTYLTILQLLSSGLGKRREIENVLDIDAGTYLKRLEEEHGLVQHISPVFSSTNNRNTRWVVSDMYLRFYFRFVRPSSNYVESGRYDLLLRAIERDLPDYEGRILEDFFRRRISEEDVYTEVGSYWNRKGDIEIDIVVLDDIVKQARLIEVKRNSSKLNMSELMTKADSLSHELKGYEVSFEGLSMDDVKR